MTGAHCNTVGPANHDLESKHRRSRIRTSRGRVPAFASLICAVLAWSATAHAESCATASASSNWQPPEVASRNEDLNFDTLAERLARQRVVMIGEAHDRYDHHLNQLELICRLYRKHPNLAIGLEFFQQPFQNSLDAFVAGLIDTGEMLAQTEYYTRWQFDYRLYAPILEFARERKIPLVALNATAEISSKVAREGLSSLSAAERAQVPLEIDRDLPGYRDRLKTAFDQHPEIRHMNFENFVEAQLVWDESMAARAARYLDENPSRPLVVLAGGGHVVRSGIPARFERRSGVHPAVVLQGDNEPNSPEEADYLLVSQPIELPPGGRLGVMLDTKDNRVVVSGFSDDSAAKEAGILERDKIVKLDGQLIKSFADLKILLMNKRPGDAVAVTVERAGTGTMTREADFDLTLR